MPRKIVVFSSKTNAQRVLTPENTPNINSINTWGQLKAIIPDLVSGDMIATMVQTKTSLTNDASVLAYDTNEAVHVVITPAKVKSGIVQLEESELMDLISEIDSIKNRLTEYLSTGGTTNNLSKEEQEMLKMAQEA